MDHNKTTISIGVFIDGGYYRKVAEFYESQDNKTLSMKALLRYIAQKVQEIEKNALHDCQITDVHYFRGRYKTEEQSVEEILEERRFEDKLIDCDVVMHYRHLNRQVHQNGEQQFVRYQEKGIDVWFALEALELTRQRSYDYVALITGDADHEMLIKKIKALKTKTLLLYWNLPGTYTARSILEETNFRINMAKLLSEGKGKDAGILTTFRVD